MSSAPERRSAIVAAAAALLLTVSPPCSSSASQASGPQPPCGGRTPAPAYADLGAAPNVAVWSGDQSLAGDWRPPPCTGWTSPEFTTLVALAARFRHDGTVDDLLERLGAISKLTEVRYWSVSRGEWRDLVEEAHALTATPGDDGGRHEPRADFSASEMRTGRALYFYQNDTGPAGGAVYRMRVREVDADRLVAEVANVTAIKTLFLTLFAPGALQSAYVLERLSPNEGVWGYYSLTRATVSQALLGDHDASFVNRAAAIYRCVAGIPTAKEPPLAP
jgi:hypothetical protein